MKHFEDTVLIKHKTLRISQKMLHNLFNQIKTVSN